MTRTRPSSNKVAVSPSAVLIFIAMEGTMLARSASRFDPELLEASFGSPGVLGDVSKMGDPFVSA